MKTIVRVPNDAIAMYVMAHGAGAGMRHPFMRAMAAALARERIASLRYEFPYMAAGRRAPDRAPVLEATVRAAIGFGHRRELPLFAGGKSMGGRMTSQLVAREGALGGRGLVFLGFPFHAPKQPSEARAAHLREVHLPMLFIQGTRDPLADIELVRRLSPGELFEVEEGDHSFVVPKRTGRTSDDVIARIAREIRLFCERHLTALA